MLGRAFLSNALLLSFIVVGCGGSSESDDGSERGGNGAGGAATGGSGGSTVGGSSSGGTSGSASGGSSSGGTSGSASGGTSSGGTGGLPPDFTSCDVPSDCVLAGNSCCICGVPELSNMTAVNVESATDYFTSICPMGPTCACPTALNPNLFATCDGGMCRAIDVRQDPSSACADSADCRVRVRQCCECGGDTSPGSLIAVGPNNAYDELVCDPQAACAECAPTYPSEAITSCEAGHCVLVDARLQ